MTSQVIKRTNNLLRLKQLEVLVSVIDKFMTR